MLNNAQDWKEQKDKVHQCFGCPFLKDGICMDVTEYTGETMEADNVLSCGIRDERWERRDNERHMSMPAK